MTVYLVGAGPGAPDLLTLRAAHLISIAEVIIHDRLIHPGVLAHAKPHARLIYVGKEGGGDSTAQADINALLVQFGRSGRTVVRLKGGDPFIFGRGGEEALALEAAGIAYEVVPGVTSGTAGPSAAGIPLTHRTMSTSVTFATAQLAAGEPDWAHLARAQTLVLFMAGKNAGTILEKLMAAGLAPTTPAAIIEAATWEHQRVIEGTAGSLGSDVLREGIGSPALLVIGPVVALRHQLLTLAQVAQQDLVNHA